MPCSEIEQIGLTDDFGSSSSCQTEFRATISRKMRYISVAGPQSIGLPLALAAFHTIYVSSLSTIFSSLMFWFGRTHRPSSRFAAYGSSSRFTHYLHNVFRNLRNTNMPSVCPSTISRRWNSINSAKWKIEPLGVTLIESDV